MRRRCDRIGRLALPRRVACGDVGGGASPLRPCRATGRSASISRRNAPPATRPAAGRSGGIPAIVGLPADQFVALMGAYKDKHRDNQVMQTIAGRLSQEEIAALAAYYDSLKPAK